jgi:hypothetical protein
VSKNLFAIFHPRGRDRLALEEHPALRKARRNQRPAGQIVTVNSWGCSAHAFDPTPLRLSRQFSSPQIRLFSPSPAVGAVLNFSRRRAFPQVIF